MRMVTRIRERVLGGLSVATAITTLLVGAAIPLLDIDPRMGIAFEATHDSGCMVIVHDHSVCAQFGNQQLASADPDTAFVRLPLVGVTLAPPLEPTAPVWTSARHLPRAPPLIESLA